ncbi:MAG: LysM peptidoglycan-binding domain-containing protein [Pyrinomonadaceae bacterium]
MAENVTYFGDLADKFDALVAYDEKLLDEYVEESGYSLRSMVAASTAIAFMRFAKGFVDVGRLGNGILIEGGFKGVGSDVLRALNLVGGLGAAAGRVPKLLRVVQVGNTCAPVAQTNAIRLAGSRYLLTVEELAAKSGINLQAIAAAGRQSDTYTRMIAGMQQMGIAVRTIASGSTLTAQRALELVRANPGGVVTFSIRTAAGLKAHRLYATFSRGAGIAIRDPNSRFTVYRSLADLERVWGKGAIVSESPLLFIPNALMTTAAAIADTVGGFSALGSLAIQVVPVVQVGAGDDETVVQALIIREAMATTGGQPPGVPSSASGLTGKDHRVVSGDWLSKLAKHYYGNMHKWPVIFEANRKTIGRNPDLIKPGQRLFIPNLPHARLIAANSLPGQGTAFA